MTRTQVKTATQQDATLQLNIVATEDKRTMSLKDVVESLKPLGVTSNDVQSSINGAIARMASKALKNTTITF